jgi:hypothetical protein
MKIEVACFCDAATEHAGRLNIMGIFDEIPVSNFPYEHAQCALVFRLRFSAADMGSQHFKLSISDSDGTHLIPELNAEMRIPFMDDDGEHLSNFVLNLQGLKFPEPGRFSANLSVNQKHVLSLPLKLTEN